MRRKYISGIFLMVCSLGGSNSGFRAISKKLLGVSASSKGSVNPFFGLKEDATPFPGHLWRPHLATGDRYKNKPEPKKSGAGVFFSSYLPMGRRGTFCRAHLPAICNSALPPFISPGERQVRSRVKVLVGLRKGRVTNFLCVVRAAP